MKKLLFLLLVLTSCTAEEQAISYEYRVSGTSGNYSVTLQNAYDNIQQWDPVGNGWWYKWSQTGTRWLYISAQNGLQLYEVKVATTNFNVCRHFQPLLFCIAAVMCLV